MPLEVQEQVDQQVLVVLELLAITAMVVTLLQILVALVEEPLLQVVQQQAVKVVQEL
jgi:hypothetical protein